MRQARSMRRHLNCIGATSIGCARELPAEEAGKAPVELTRKLAAGTGNKRKKGPTNEDEPKPPRRKKLIQLGRSLSALGIRLVCIP